jgi:4,5-DOPA dioxygenase extradiol
MPALFVGHGSPTNAIDVNEFSRAWTDIGRSLPRPKAIVAISAHWETSGTRLTAMPEPSTLYDFHGFPQPLYEMQYPAPGAPDLARSIKEAIPDPVMHLDFGWGLDHGSWSVLCRMFPDADIPVIQVGLDFTQPADYHYQLGQKLKYLRKRQILVIGSGNMVHNLRSMVWENTAFDWARNFDEILSSHILAGRHAPLIDYHSLDETAAMAIPTNEHYLPLLYILGMQEPSDTITFFCDKVTLGSISMRSLILKPNA